CRTRRARARARRRATTAAADSGASHAPRRMVLLADGARVAGHRFAGGGAERIDVEPAAPGVASVHRQPRGGALALQVQEDALDARLVEIGVGAERGEVAQQPGAVDARALVGDLHARPVRLAG